MILLVVRSFQPSLSKTDTSWWFSRGPSLANRWHWAPCRSGWHEPGSWGAAAAAWCVWQGLWHRDWTGRGHRPGVVYSADQYQQLSHVATLDLDSKKKNTYPGVVVMESCRFKTETTYPSFFLRNSAIIQHFHYRLWHLPVGHCWSFLSWRRSSLLRVINNQLFSVHKHLALIALIRLKDYLMRMIKMPVIANGSLNILTLFVLANHWL